MSKYRIEDLRKETLEAVLSEHFTIGERWFLEAGGDEARGEETKPEQVRAEVDTFWRLADQCGLTEHIDRLNGIVRRHPDDADDFFRVICAEMFFLAGTLAEQ